jgi:hypothetical protein
VASLVVRDVAGWGWLLAWALSLTGCAAGPEERVVAVPRTLASPAAWPLTRLDEAMALPVTADVLYTVYSRNLILGATPDQHFLDRTLMVTGIFNGTNRRTPGRTLLELRTHDDGAFVYAELGAQPPPRTLVPGERVRLLCRCNGMVAGSPMLSQCRAE